MISILQQILHPWTCTPQPPSLEFTKTYHILKTVHQGILQGNHESGEETTPLFWSEPTISWSQHHLMLSNFLWQERSCTTNRTGICSHSYRNHSTSFILPEAFPVLFYPFWDGEDQNLTQHPIRRIWRNYGAVSLYYFFLFWWFPKLCWLFWCYWCFHRTIYLQHWDLILECQ